MWCNWCKQNQPNNHDQLECWSVYRERRAIAAITGESVPMSKQTIAQLEISVLEDWWAQPSTHGR